MYNSITLKVEYPETRSLDNIRRISGFIKVRGMIDLITELDLDANPRSAKRSSVTAEIVETIQTTPELYPFKSKGILLGASAFQELGRGSYELNFKDRKLEGILDGGHNTLAIGLYLLAEAGVPEKALGKARTWNEMKELWEKNILNLKKLKTKASRSHDAMVPVEILVPNHSDEESIDSFLSSILLICAARNNNVQLKNETIANQDGIFDSLKESLPNYIREAIIWKTNGSGRIPVGNFLSLVWVPLGKVDFSKVVDSEGKSKNITPIPGSQAYSSVSECIKRYQDLISADSISQKSDDMTTWELKSMPIQSALDMVEDVTKVYDLVYQGYKDAYNSNRGRFAGIDAVKTESSKNKNKYTLFAEQPIEHEVPPRAYMMPIMYSMRAIIDRAADGTLSWAVNPIEFYGNKENLARIVGSLKNIMELVDWDPQNVGKKNASYQAVENTVNTMKLEYLAKHR